jgi:outer membrane immunogenic protein
MEGVPQMMSCRILPKRLLAGAVAAAAGLCFGLAGAHAADLAPHYTKAAAAAGAAWDWSGFYLGADVGGASQTTSSGHSEFFESADGSPNPESQAPSSSGVIGGVHLGYNWQMAHVVLGVEGDWQWTQASYSFCRKTDFFGLPCSDHGLGFVNVQSETRGIGTVRGRIGYAFDRVLVYGTGGVAFADLRGAITADCRVAGCASDGTRNLSTANFSTLKTGWVAGVGAELMLSPNWIVRSEYLHVDVGSVSDTLTLAPVNCVNPGPCGASWSRSQRYDIGRIGFSYKFGGANRVN